MKLVKILLAAVLCIVTVQSYAQEDSVPKKKTLFQKQYPAGMDNHSYAVLYYNGKNVYNNRGFVISSTGDSIQDLKINPSNTSYATLKKNKKGYSYVYIYDINTAENLLKRIKVKDNNATAIAYSKDAKQLAIAYADKNIAIYNPIKYDILRTYTSTIVPNKMEYSDNNFFLATSNGQSIEIWNLEKGTVRKSLNFEEKVNDFMFSEGSNCLYVATADGKLNIYDTKTFNKQSTIDHLGNALACYPSNTEKYVSVLESDKRICIVNTLDPTERYFLEDLGGISAVRTLFNPIEKKTEILYNSTYYLVYEKVDGLKPYYNKMMTSMLTERLTEWTKQMPEESLEAYQMRVNETTRAAQAKELERELATQMATGLLEQSEVTIGDYNTNKKSLALHFNSMPDIYLDVPSNDVNAFTDASKLQFRNVKYGLNADDKFEVVYAEVYNPENDKTYLFDNTERQSLAFMQEDDFVPLEIVQKSNMEETALVSIKEDFVNDAKQEQVITDKTHISVKTEAVPSTNAEGEKIVNYNVDFTYEVEEEFSARDDFKPGRYHTNESPAAMLMLKIMKQAFEKDFAKYMTEGKKVKIKVKGTADASPINGTIAYDGKYGEYNGEPAYKNNELNNITLNKKDGIGNNEQLAFARAIGVQNYIEKEISAFGKMNREYEYHIEVSNEEGSKYRRISVQYTFVDAF